MRHLLALVGAALVFAITFQLAAPRDRRVLSKGIPTNLASLVEERGVGRQATSPAQIPKRGWWRILKRTATKFTENELTSEAASVTFFALLSIFPALTAVVSIYGLFAEPSAIELQVDQLSGFMPSGGLDLVRDQIHRLAQTPSTGLGLGALIGVLAALWSANQGSKAMFSALNDVYGEREKRNYFRVVATSLAFTIGGIGFLLLAVTAIAFAPSLLKAVHLDWTFETATLIARWPVTISIIAVGLSVLYRFGPSRQYAKWRWVTLGSLLAATGWVALSFAFSWYVANFGAYNRTYGSLGAIVGFMTWIWLSSTVLLIGAQLNAEMETQTARDSTAGEEVEIGLRGAAAADTVSA